ncbi:MAG: endonuclease/exonuclease/phosphatase family protein [Gemmatimonadaceae bacterium]
MLNPSMLSCLAGPIAMFGAPAPTQNVTPVALRVMTYNIQYGGGDIERTSAAIRAAGPDLVALQEVDVHWGARSEFVDQASRLAERLGMQVRFAPIYRLPGADSASPPRGFGVALRSRHQGTSFTNRLLARLRDSWPVAAGPGGLPTRRSSRPSGSITCCCHRNSAWWPPAFPIPRRPTTAPSWSM